MMQTSVETLVEAPATLDAQNAARRQFRRDAEGLAKRMGDALDAYADAKRQLVEMARTAGWESDRGFVRTMLEIHPEPKQTTFL